MTDQDHLHPFQASRSNRHRLDGFVQERPTKDLLLWRLMGRSESSSSPMKIKRTHRVLFFSGRQIFPLVHPRFVSEQNRRLYHQRLRLAIHQRSPQRNHRRLQRRMIRIPMTGSVDRRRCRTMRVHPQMNHDLRLHQHLVTSLNRSFGNLKSRNDSFVNKQTNVKERI